MKYTLILSLTAFIQIGFAQESVVIDKIIAQVGDEVILLSDIQAQKLQMIQAGMEVNKLSDCMLLEELMFQKLLINQALLDSVAVSDEQVDAEMENRLRMIEKQIGGRQKLGPFTEKA